jgi:outer membrane lipoprotein-sorting protein
VDCTLQSDKAIIEQLNSMQSSIEDVAGEMEKTADNQAAIAQYEELDEEATTIIGRLVRRSR